VATNDTPVEQVQNAICDLNTAYAIIALCEGGLFRTPNGNKFASKIVRLCKDHAGTQLRAYDRASAKEPT